jgi:hypothetical protein
MPASPPGFVRGANRANRWVVDFPIRYKKRNVGAGSADGRMADRQLDKVINLSLVFAPFRKTDVTAFKLVAPWPAGFIDCNDILALLKGSVGGNVNYRFPFGSQKLAERYLVRTLVGASQPVFDYSLDYARHRVSCSAALRTWP